LEEAAREVRHDFLNRTARTWNCNRIALGHNRGDQAETLIHRLVRGVGPPGLAAMRFREDRIIRPLLAFSRGEIIAYLQQRDIEFRTDPTNYDTRYTRNRIRHEILPLLALVNPQVEKQLFQLSRLAAEDEDCWQEAVSGFLPAVWTGTAEGGELEVQPLRQAHSALRKRVIRFCLALVRGDLAGLGQAQIEAVDALLFSTSPHAEIDLKGCWAGRNYGRLCLQPRRPAAPADYCFCIDGPGELAIPDLGCLQVSGPELPQGEDRWEVEFSAEALSFPLLIRSFRAGDTFRPAGMNGRKKLKNLFIDLKIERFWRARIPLVTTPAGEIVWVVGVRRSALFRPSGGDSRVLRLAFRPENGYKNLSL
jgi:tRNA(Ile)-lysidine synthase